MQNSRLIAAALTLAAVFALTAACGSDDGEADETTSSSDSRRRPSRSRRRSRSRPGPKKYDAPPSMTIDPDKKYTATFNLEKGDTLRGRAVREGGPDDGQQLRLPGPRRLLRRCDLPPGNPRLHGPGRRSDRHRDERTGLHDPGRVQPAETPRQRRCPVHGEHRKPEQRRRTVVHHLRPNPSPGRRSHGVREGCGGHGGGQQHHGPRSLYRHYTRAMSYRP